MHRRNALRQFAGAWLLLLVTGAGALGLSVVFSASVKANGIRVALKVKGDLYRPVAPVQKNFRTCFKFDAQGNTVISLCSDDEREETLPRQKRAPAAGKGARPSFSKGVKKIRPSRPPTSR